MRIRMVAMCACLLSGGAMADGAQVYAAGSLKAVFSRLGGLYAEQGGAAPRFEFGPSGLLRERIQGGAPADLFASANMKHPQALVDAGKGATVTQFARNELCLLVRPGLDVTSGNALAQMLRRDVKLGVSTPKADPSGDYAVAMFRRADALRPGIGEALRARAMQLTGGPASARPPQGRNNYAWVVDSGQADVFVTYCTNVRLARREVPALQEVALPEALRVGADYGLVVLSGAGSEGEAFARFLQSPPARKVMQDAGFSTP
jgi:molybdate transport system substrate-binding protein